MKKITTMAIVALCAISLNLHAEELKTVRGAAIDTQIAAENSKELITGKDDNPEVFNQHEVEPSMIPHDISSYTITTKQNMCLMCHKEGIGGATKLPESHFTDDRSGEITENVDGRRYFCTQCHSVQTDVDPLVNNKSYE